MTKNICYTFNSTIFTNLHLSLSYFLSLKKRWKKNLCVKLSKTFMSVFYNDVAIETVVFYRGIIVSSGSTSVGTLPV